MIPKLELGIENISLSYSIFCFGKKDLYNGEDDGQFGCQQEHMQQAGKVRRTKYFHNK